MERKKTNLNVKVNEIVWDEFKLAAKKRRISIMEAMEKAFSDFTKKEPKK